MDSETEIKKAVGNAIRTLGKDLPANVAKNAYLAIGLSGIAGQLKPPLAVQLIRIINKLL